LLIYPIVDHNSQTTSYLENSTGYHLTRAAMIWFWDQYAPNVANRSHPYASPLLAEDLSGLPPALVCTAQYDPLRDEGEAYAAKLKQAGVNVTLSRYDGMIHGFVRQVAAMSRSREALAEFSSALRSAFNASSTVNFADRRPASR
jgi:acetyl esterase